MIIIVKVSFNRLKLSSPGFRRRRVHDTLIKPTSAGKVILPALLSFSIVDSQIFIDGIYVKPDRTEAMVLFELLFQSALQ